MAHPTNDYNAIGLNIQYKDSDLSSDASNLVTVHTPNKVYNMISTNDIR